MALILTHWRILNGSCKLCKKIICNCTTWCRCTQLAIKRYYESLWIMDDAPTEEALTEKRIDVILSEIQDLKKLWHMLWKELHELPLHIKHTWGIYDEETIKDINEFLRWFKVKLSCWECKEHYAEMIIKHPFTWNTPRALREYINFAHNSVSERLWKKTQPLSTAIINIAKYMKTLWYVRWLDIYDYNWGYNITE